MKEVEYPMEVVNVKCFCDCGGEYIYNGVMLMSSPPRYPHRCNECGKGESFRDTYPLIRYKEKE